MVAGGIRGFELLTMREKWDFDLDQRIEKEAQTKLSSESQSRLT